MVLHLKFNIPFKGIKSYLQYPWDLVSSYFPSIRRFYVKCQLKYKPTRLTSCFVKNYIGYCNLSNSWSIFKRFMDHFVHKTCPFSFSNQVTHDTIQVFGKSSSTGNTEEQTYTHSSNQTLQTIRVSVMKKYYHSLNQCLFNTKPPTIELKTTVSLTSWEINSSSKAHNFAASCKILKMHVCVSVLFPEIRLIFFLIIPVLCVYCIATRLTQILIFWHPQA